MSADAREFRCEALVTGTLADAPRSDTTKTGKPCAKFSLLTDGGRLFALALGETADDVLHLKQGDAVSLAGKLTVAGAEWNGHPSLRLQMLVTRALALKPKKAKRAAAQPDDDPGFPAGADDLDSAFAKREPIPA